MAVVDKKRFNLFHGDALNNFRVSHTKRGAQKTRLRTQSTSAVRADCRVMVPTTKLGKRYSSRTKIDMMRIALSGSATRVSRCARTRASPHQRT